MVLLAPTSDQKDSMDVLFRSRSQHKDNFVEWLNDCREIAVQNIINSDHADVERHVGILTAIESFKSVIEKF